MVGAGCKLSQQLHPFGTDPVLKDPEASDIAARSCEAINEAAADRIVDLYKHDRHDAGGFLAPLM